MSWPRHKRERASRDRRREAERKSQIDGLRAAEAIVAILALVALPCHPRIPTVQPGAHQAQITPDVANPLLSRNGSGSLGRAARKEDEP
jgi:hypothetical protein